MFIMRRIRQAKQPLDIDKDALTTNNKMHVGFHVRVERGIGGLKHKFWRLMKR